MKPLTLILLAGAAFLGAAAANAESGPAPAHSRHTSAAPAVLNDAERAGYAAIFAAIRTGNWTDASARLDAMGDGVLHPVARAELYLAKGSPKVPLEPLLDLLAKAPDMPEAAQLARLAVARGATEVPALPQLGRLVWYDGQPRRLRAKGTAKTDPLAAEVESLVQPLIRENRPAEAEALLVQRELLLAADILTEYRQRIGWSYYSVGDDAAARRLADQARTGTGGWTLPAEWLAGLAAWRMRDCAAAATAFATVAARATDAEFAAGGHYWAARADMMCRRPQNVQPRLRAAAVMGESFYGLLAQSALGIQPKAARRLHDYRASEWRMIADRRNVRAAIALAQIGETGLADEMIRHQARLQPADHAALIHLACNLDLPATQLWLSHNRPPGAQVNMAARYPAPEWRPARGWRVDRSLVFAHTLQESRFRPDVVSPAGAVGLMQVMPGTASGVARRRGESFEARQLTVPATNMEFGQSYLEYLRDFRATGALLPKVIAAYNAGPAPISDWNARAFDRGDPLLYIESIPYWETRAYVPTVLRNYWMYEEVTGRKQSTSREALVQGLWPRFPGLPGPTAVRVSPGYAASQVQADPK